ncbi:MAG: phage terminase large subunit family protein, partial [Anaerolineae bacterium]|nr:phage terminase large subunit family protein [Anaerolineae bacterium]
GLAFVDEIDSMVADVKKQGDPLGHVLTRGSTYPDFTAIIASTPSLGKTKVAPDPVSGVELWELVKPEDLSSAIWDLWQKGTRYHWAWMCPHCRKWFVPRLSLVKWPQDASPFEVREQAWMECPSCQKRIEDSHKQWMNANGHYIAPGQRIERGKIVGDPPPSMICSFWVSGLASPFQTFGQRAAMFVSALKSDTPADIQVVVNQQFGELFVPYGDRATDYALVASHRTSYRKGEVPEGVLVLTAGIDVQKNKLVFVVRGWGAGGTSWLIDYGELLGNTADTGISGSLQPPVWDALTNLLQQQYAGLPIALAIIDAGFRPNIKEGVSVSYIYDFCRRHTVNLRPGKGASTFLGPTARISKLEIKPDGTHPEYSLEQVVINSDSSKTWVQDHLHWPDNKPGAWHLPQDVCDDYCKQIVAESRVRLPSGKVEWVEHRPNN